MHGVAAQCKWARDAFCGHLSSRGTPDGELTRGCECSATAYIRLQELQGRSGATAEGVVEGGAREQQEDADDVRVQAGHSRV